MTHDEQLELIMTQQREVNELRVAQLQRDGRILHQDTRCWLLANGTYTAAFAEGDDDGR